jgi:23S rRNA (adenine2503-C2)-methyltransferase
MIQYTQDYSDPGGRVTKFLFEDDTAVAEAVLYRYPDFQTRTVVCCSTQSGCPMGCVFCGAGVGFVRSLWASEIIAQVEEALLRSDCDPLSIKKLQIMFMSMGEPLLNWGNVKSAIMAMNVVWPNAELLLSTSAPRMANYGDVIYLSEQIPQIGLQFSVHESTDAARSRIVRPDMTLKLADIAEIGGLWHEETGRKPFFNYCAHAGNATDEDAKRLAAQFDPRVWCATVSVICEKDQQKIRDIEKQTVPVIDFETRLRNVGYDVRQFNPDGQDTIGGGCGQLWYVQRWMAKRTMGIS